MENFTQPQPILTILGPTASGKSSLALEIAQKYDGEIISVDSRQIYRGMDIGTGKVTSEEQALVPHHLLDITDPNDTYNVTDFIRDARQVLQDIQSRGKRAILCGGTGFWAQALITDQQFPAIPPDPTLRKQLSSLTPEQLLEKLQEVDSERLATVDQRNPVRLIRAIEIATTLQSDKSLIEPRETRAHPLPACIIALNPPQEKLRDNIQKRLDERFDQGMIDEVRQLHKQGISWERLESFGLEYRWISRFIQGSLTENEMREKLFFDIVHYAKRQLTWLRRWERQGTNMHWVSSNKLSKEIEQFI